MDQITKQIFDRVFDKLTNNGRELYITPYLEIKENIFNHYEIHLLIHNVTHKKIEDIRESLLDQEFQESVFSNKLGQIQSDLIFGNISKIEDLVIQGHQFDKMDLILCIVNNHVDILKILIPQVKIDHELLMHCARLGHESIYFYLRGEGLVPNESIYYNAILGNSLNIVKDISQLIGISPGVLSTAFKANNTEIILFLVNEAINDQIKIDPNLMAYPITNHNLELVIELEKMNLINWHYELYYCAILSGSLEMIYYLESKIPNIHQDHILDTSKTIKGKFSLLLNDIIYQVTNKKYFSHCINYAVQSNSVEVLEYIYSRGYGISASNFITAIKQGSIDILIFLCQNYHKELPFYLVHYFGIYSYVPDKMSKAKILLDYGLLKLKFPTKLILNDYKKETSHIDMVLRSEYLYPYDHDYLMNYQSLFVPSNGYILNYRLMVKMRVCLELNLDPEIQEIMSDSADKQLIVNMLYLLGTTEQIKKFHPTLIHKPDLKIISEITSRGQLNKLCIMYHNKILTQQIIKELKPMVTSLSNKYLDLFFSRISQENIQTIYKNE